MGIVHGLRLLGFHGSSLSVFTMIILAFTLVPVFISLTTLSAATVMTTTLPPAGTAAAVTFHRASYNAYRQHFDAHPTCFLNESSSSLSSIQVMTNHHHADNNIKKIKFYKTAARVVGHGMVRVPCRFWKRPWTSLFIISYADGTRVGAGTCT